jgi:hypothetical protein
VETAQPLCASTAGSPSRASLSWPTKRTITLGPLSVADALATARTLVALWAHLVAQERENAARIWASQREARKPQWQRVLETMADGGICETAELVSELAVLPPNWKLVVTAQMIRAFFKVLAIPCRRQDRKEALVTRLEQCFVEKPSAIVLFGEVFKRELGMPPWDLERMLCCARSERKRWTDEGKLVVVQYLPVRIAGRSTEYPVYDFRTVLRLNPEDIAGWRDEHRMEVAERRRTRSPKATCSEVSVQN